MISENFIVPNEDPKYLEENEDVKNEIFSPCKNDSIEKFINLLSPGGVYIRPNTAFKQKCSLYIF